MFGCQFARSFLHTGEHSPWVDRLLLLLMACGAVVMILALSVSYATALCLATYLALLFTAVIFAAGVLAWLRGMRVARYFIFAWTAFLIGGIVNTLMVLGYLPNVFLTMYASQIGSALEVGGRPHQRDEGRARILQDAGRKLETLNQELADSNRFKDEFLATVTHELRTPMNGVIGSLELMQTVKMDIELEQYQKTAAASARDMMRMVNDILALTELQAGKLYPRRETFSLRGLFDGLRAQYAARAEDKGLTFALELDDNLPDTLEGDAAKLAQALGYLLDNAIKFTSQGGVTLQVGRVGSVGSNLPLSVVVSDTGIGFAPVDGDLYQRFHQLDGSMTRKYGGLGIGLAICRQLVDLLGGVLSHESQPGQGSRFRLDVPLTLPLQPQASDVRPARPQGGALQRQAQQCTVLIVEDNAINQLVTRGMLLKLGYRVRTADNGAEALELLRSETVDAVLLDCQMPVMDGFATCRALRALPGCAELPVLAITAHSHSGDRERCLAAGMSDYLAKPVKFDELRVLLHDWVLCRPATVSGGAAPV
ncbi:integral membrane sensor hybrid histidine kinase [Ectopseudomonas oleovorans]|uniref:histidine kinase n=1 Tax=Ectopseudomonas oleovorans TaxID=301 RepID=A0A379K255_ECTOL|nr:integral membrane sensor hybrid histidine kinase [Pseudomonas oleovorans]